MNRILEIHTPEIICVFLEILHFFRNITFVRELTSYDCSLWEIATFKFKSKITHINVLKMRKRAFAHNTIWVHKLMDRVPHNDPKKPKKFKCQLCQTVVSNITRAKEHLRDKCPKYENPDKRLRTEQKSR